MMQINFENVEELIFSKPEVQQLLPSHFSGYYEQWKLAKRVPMLRSLGKTAMMDLLSQLKQEHIEVLKDYFQDKITVEKLNYDIVRNFQIPLSEQVICDELCGILDFSNYSLCRDDAYLYITFWR